MASTDRQSESLVQELKGNMKSEISVDNQSEKKMISIFSACQPDVQKFYYGLFRLCEFKSGIER